MGMENLMTDEKTRTLLGWLGKIVTVHLEAEQTTGQSLRRGHLTSTPSDGKGEITVYLMECSPVGESYTGRVVSVMRAFRGDGDCLIVSPVGKEQYEPWIRAAVEKMQSVEDTRFFCLYEKSCGVIPYRFRDGHLEYLALYQSGSGTWSFPKGHMELGEDELETARREAYEEIGVTLTIPRDFRCEISYSVHNRRSKKKVVLYAVPFDGEVTLRAGEIEDAKWLPRSEIQKLFGHRELRGIFNRLEKTVTRTPSDK